MKALSWLLLAIVAAVVLVGIVVYKTFFSTVTEITVVCTPNNMQTCTAKVLNRIKNCEPTKIILKSKPEAIATYERKDGICRYSLQLEGIGTVFECEFPMNVWKEYYKISLNVNNMTFSEVLEVANKYLKYCKSKTIVISSPTI